MRIDDDILSQYVYLRDDGVIVVESILEKQLGNDIDRLLSCVADNIIETDEGEQIDYVKAIKDFDKEE